MLASAEYMNKEYDKALADARRTHTLPNHEQFADVHLLAGKILEMQNQAQAAIVEYQLFLKESPNSPQVPAGAKGSRSVRGSKPVRTIRSKKRQLTSG